MPNRFTGKTQQNKSDNDNIQKQISRKEKVAKIEKNIKIKLPQKTLFFSIRFIASPPSHKYDIFKL